MMQASKQKKKKKCCGRFGIDKEREKDAKKRRQRCISIVVLLTVSWVDPVPKIVGRTFEHIISIEETYRLIDVRQFG